MSVFVSVLLVLANHLSLFLADNDAVTGTILVITEDRSGSCSSNSTLTSYVETRDGFPTGVTRCNKSSTSSSGVFIDDFQFTEEDDCIGDIADVLDLCQAAFVENDRPNSTHCLRAQSVVMSDGDLSNASFPSSVYFNVCMPFRAIRRQYLNFEAILDRTLVGVYLKTCENKTICLVSILYIVIVMIFNLKKKNKKKTCNKNKRTNNRLGMCFGGGGGVVGGLVVEVL